MFFYVFMFLNIQLLHSFHTESYFFESLLNYSSLLSEVSNVGFLWFREFYLEKANAIQFPIEMSMPWILAEQCIGGAGGQVCQYDYLYLRLCLRLCSSLSLSL